MDGWMNLTKSEGPWIDPNSGFTAHAAVHTMRASQQERVSCPLGDAERSRVYDAGFGGCFEKFKEEIYMIPFDE